MGKFAGFFVAFILVFLTSLVLHLPLSWLLNQQVVKEQVPKNIILKPVSGTWWNGVVKVSMKTPAKKVSLGSLSYRLSWSDLVFARLAADVDWKLATGKLKTKFTFDGKLVNVIDLTGDMPVSELMKLSPQTTLLEEAKGELHLLSVNLSSPINQPWPTSLSGKLTISNLSVLGANIGLLETNPKLKENKIEMNIFGGQKSKGWQLNADTLLTKKHRYKLDVKVSATSAKNMPDWVELMLPMQNPTLAHLRKQGSW